MNFTVRIHLATSSEQAQRLLALQEAFAEVCNALAPIVRATRCWNRVGLHHLAYRDMRARFPNIGSQMVCNAIYSVSRTCRLVFQHPASPFNITKRGNQALPLLKFLPSAPVYFDRHTLSLKNGKLSMYTLDRRMHFHLDLKAEDQERFYNEKLREIVLSRLPSGFHLSFTFSATDEDTEVDNRQESNANFPEYLIVSEAEPESPSVQETSAQPAIPTAQAA